MAAEDEIRIRERLSKLRSLPLLGAPQRAVGRLIGGARRRFTDLLPDRDGDGTA